MPSQADEEAHQLSYLQKHITNILALLAEPVEGEDDESLVGISRVPILLLIICVLTCISGYICEVYYIVCWVGNFFASFVDFDP